MSIYIVTLNIGVILDILNLEGYIPITIFVCFLTTDRLESLLDLATNISLKW